MIELRFLLEGWLENPRLAMATVTSWLEPAIDGTFTLSTHAIKIKYPDEDFTVDLVIGWRQQKGIVIPHCPDDEPHRWTPTDPETHKEQAPVVVRSEHRDDSAARGKAPISDKKVTQA